ncbi:MAG: hypothetical protein CVU69_05515 [Deltaproteobacteria bacterium HGW-Deltaproteobacteria-4]|nr:MAG: hypothetical protein CVU69_05515 [Deltaproteobacteria bacterium HGW-Deltaproteobacteria-4]
MKRFRVTLLVVCLVLGWLGVTDLALYLRNPEPHVINITELTRQGAPREWLKIEGGYRDLLQAINMSGTVEISSFLVPLKASETSEDLQIWFETRDPQILNALKTYYFDLDTEITRAEFLKENRQLFIGQYDLQGMTVSSLIADSNASKLKELLTKMNIPVSEQVIFISEGKKPSSGRGLFFAAMALLGLGKLLFDLCKKPNKEVASVI